MIFRVLLWLVIVILGVALVRSQDYVEYSPHLQTIRTDLFEILSSYTPISLQQDLPDQPTNVYFFPALEKIRVYMAQMQIYYQTNMSSSVTRDRALEIPYAFAPMLDELQRSSNAKLKFKFAMFYDKRYLSERYVNDVETHYHVDKYQSPFVDSAIEREQMAKKIVSWMFNATAERQLISRTGPQMINKIASRTDVMSFVGCWDVPKVAIDFTNRVEVAADTVTTTRIKSFTNREAVGHYNDAERRYEAIKIPFEKGEFVMVVVLPYYNQSLEFLAAFTKQDYRDLFRRVNDTYEYVFYTIPFINSTYFHVDEKGANIYGDRGAAFCDTRTVVSASSTYDRNEVGHKLFVADRPFAAFIYHDKTGIPLMEVLVKNITSSSWIPPQLVVRVNGFNAISIAKKGT